jgi:flagellar basal-body rod protein FlgF
MNYGLYLAASGAKAQMDRMDVISNNLANARTTGFKRDLVNMQARRNAALEDPRMAAYRMPVLRDQGGGVLAMGAGIDMTQGTFESSSNATDVALNGKGFFTVKGENDERLLTRDGRFVIDPNGRLVTAAGSRPVLDSSGEEITLTSGLPVAVGADGQISQGDGETGVKLGLVDVADTRQLEKLGGNVMRARGEVTEVSAATQVMQYKLEASGVDEMVEIVNMMQGQRAFEANARMMTFQDQTMGQLATVGRVA